MISSPFRFPERVEKIVSLAGNAYFTQAEVDGMIGLRDVSQWSEEWSNLMKMQWTTQRSLEDIYGKVIFSYIIEIEQMHSVTILFRKVKGSMVSKDLFTQLLFEHSLARFNRFLGQVVTSSA